MKIYTRTGDAGETSLFGGARIAKNDLRIDAYGTIDELNSFLGLARANWPSSPIDAELAKVQSDLFDIGAHLAAPDSDRFAGVPQTRDDRPTAAIDREYPVARAVRDEHGRLAVQRRRCHEPR